MAAMETAGYYARDGTLFYPALSGVAEATAETLAGKDSRSHNRFGSNRASEFARASISLDYRQIFEPRDGRFKSVACADQIETMTSILDRVFIAEASRG